MAKKAGFNLFYFIGMILVLLGFLMPVLEIEPLDDSGFSLLCYGNIAQKMAAALIFVSGILGFASSFSSGLYLCCFPAVIVGILSSMLIVFSSGTNIAHFMSDLAGSGFYLILIGWAGALVGFLAFKK